jgi:hypothetical protein
VLFFAPSVWNNWGFDAIMIFFRFSKKRTNNQHFRITPYVKVIQSTIGDRHPKLFENIADFMNVIFPLNAAPSNRYSLTNQAAFEIPNIEYSILTWHNKFDAHRVELENVQGLARIRRWHPNFSIPDSVKKYYFDHDCDYHSGDNFFHDSG